MNIGLFVALCLNIFDRDIDGCVPRGLYLTPQSRCVLKQEFTLAAYDYMTSVQRECACYTLAEDPNLWAETWSEKYFRALVIDPGLCKKPRLGAEC